MVSIPTVVISSKHGNTNLPHLGPISNKSGNMCASIYGNFESGRSKKEEEVEEEPVHEIEENLGKLFNQCKEIQVKELTITRIGNVDALYRAVACLSRVSRRCRR